MSSSGEKKNLPIRETISRDQGGFSTGLNDEDTLSQHEYYSKTNTNSYSHNDDDGSGKVPPVICVNPLNISPPRLTDSQKKNSIQPIDSSFDDKEVLRYWQSPQKHQCHRHKMIRQIVIIVERIFLNASPERRTKLPKMVRQLEAKLYHTANSLGDYMDFTTLENRLSIMLKASLEKKKLPMVTIPPKKDPIRSRVLRLLLLHHAGVCSSETCSIGKDCQDAKRLCQHMIHCRYPRRCSIPHCHSSHSVLRHFKRCKDQGCPVCVPVRNKRLFDSVKTMDTDIHHKERRAVLPVVSQTQRDCRQLDISMQDFPIQCYPVEMPQPTQGAYAYASSRAGNRQQKPPLMTVRKVSQERAEFGLKDFLPDNDWKADTTDIITNNIEEHRQQQQQLSLLLHAHKCRHNKDADTPCPHNMHCTNMKQLLKHMEECNNRQHCELPQCRSSWDLLQRYQSRSSRNNQKRPQVQENEPINKGLKRPFPVDEIHALTPQAKRVKHYPRNSSENDLMREVYKLFQL